MNYINKYAGLSDNTNDLMRDYGTESATSSFMPPTDANNGDRNDQNDNQNDDYQNGDDQNDDQNGDDQNGDNQNGDNRDETNNQNGGFWFFGKNKQDVL